MRSHRHPPAQGGGHMAHEMLHVVEDDEHLSSARQRAADLFYGIPLLPQVGEIHAQGVADHVADVPRRGGFCQHTQPYPPCPGLLGAELDAAEVGDEARLTNASRSQDGDEPYAFAETLPQQRQLLLTAHQRARDGGEVAAPLLAGSQRPKTSIRQ
jgi:hypothetical protein